MMTPTSPRPPIGHSAPGKPASAAGACMQVGTASQTRLHFSGYCGGHWQLAGTIQQLVGSLQCSTARSQPCNYRNQEPGACSLIALQNPPTPNFPPITLCGSPVSRAYGKVAFPLWAKTVFLLTQIALPFPLPLYSLLQPSQILVETCVL